EPEARREIVHPTGERRERPIEAARVLEIVELDEMGGHMAQSIIGRACGSWTGDIIPSISPREMTNIPEREIRAVHDDKTIRVYQAYSDQIADSALANGRFVSPPFSMSRMT